MPILIGPTLAREAHVAMHIVRSTLFGPFLQKVRITLPNIHWLVTFWASCPRSVSKIAFIKISRLLIFHHHLRATTIKIIERTPIGGYRILVAVESNGHGARLAHVALRFWHVAAEVCQLGGAFAAWRHALLIKTLGVDWASCVHRTNLLDRWLALLPLSWLRLSFVSALLMLVMNNLWHLMAIKLFPN